MKNFLILFREPDGRTESHTEDAVRMHQLNWKNWIDKWSNEGCLAGGNSLTLNGKIIKGENKQVTEGIHKVGTEIVGGFLLIKAVDLTAAVEITKSCPIFEFDGYAEVREIQ